MTERPQITKSNHGEIFERIEAALLGAFVVACVLLRLPFWKGLVIVTFGWLLVHTGIVAFRRRIFDESPDMDDQDVRISVGAIVRDARRCGDEELARRVEKTAKERNIRTVTVIFTAAQLLAMRRDKATLLGFLHQVADVLDVGNGTDPVRLSI